jgi:outer membrane protein insertion porin family
MTRALSGWVLGCLTLLAAPALRAAPQEPAADLPVIERVEIVGALGREDEIRASVGQQDGARFDPPGLQRDIQWLWRYRRIRVDSAVLTPGSAEGRAVLQLEVHAFQSFARAVFAGNEEFDRAELELHAGLFGQALDIETIGQVVRRVEDFYRDEGYAHVRVEWQTDESAREIRFHVNEGPLARVAELEFEGAAGIRPGGRWYPGLDLFGALKHKPGFLLVRDSPYSETRLQEDANALLQLYADYGYRDAQVKHRVEYLDEEQSEVRVTYEIVEGPQYQLRSIRVVSDDGTPLRFAEAELLAVCDLQPGQPFEAARLSAAIGALTRKFAAAGHPSLARADVASQRRDQFFQVGGNHDLRAPGPRVVFDREQAAVDLVFEVHEGRSKSVRDVIIRGLQRTEDRVARREVSIEPGQPANEDELQRTGRRLIGQGYYTDEDRTPYVIGRWRDFGDDGAVDLSLDLKDLGSTGQFRIGGAYNTDSGPALILDMEKRNFDITDMPSSFGDALSEILEGEAFTGAGQSLRLGLHPGTRFSTYSVSFTEPDLLREHVDRLSLTVSAAKRLRLFSNYEEERGSGSFSLGRRFGRYFTIFAGPEIEGLEVRDIDPSAPAGLLDQAGETDLNTLSFGFRYDTVEDPFSPVDGGSIGMSFGETGRLLGGDEEYFTASLSVETFFPLWEDRLARHWVLALHGRARQGWASGGGNLPYTEQFYLGGQSSVRGFDYRGIGEDANAFAHGGDTAWDGSLEVRFPILSTRQRGIVEEYEWVRGALFLDAGSFGDDFGDLDPTRAAFGVGIRMRLPLLPLVPFTLDFGWPIASEEDDDLRTISFTLGTF